MSRDVYSGIRLEILFNEWGDKKVYIYDETGSYNPKLILPNLVAVKNLRDHLTKIIKEEK